MKINYSSEAQTYASSVNAVNSELEVILNKINEIGRKFDINKEIKDMLTYNVIISNSEIASEVSTIIDSLHSFSSLIRSRANTLDENNNVTTEEGGSDE